MSVSAPNTTADYDPIAAFYDRHWSSHYHRWAMAMLEKLLLPALPERAGILDVCCGNGILAQHLAARGYRVTGIDASEEMLRYARKQSPESSFIQADVRLLQLRPAFHGAISTFDSLNHILLAEELFDVFRNVHRSLLPRGTFVFDLNLEQSYLTTWNNTCASIGEKHACFIRGGYDPTTRLGHTEITLFEQNGSWHRSDVTFLQRFHPTDDVLHLLSRAGFATPRAYRPIEDLGMEGSFGEGRAVFVTVR